MRDFAKDMCTKYQFIKTTYTLYSDSWPQLEIILTNDQIYKFKSMYDLKSLISHCEIVANETLTFDLRTLPGEAWNVDAKTFM